MTEYKGITRSPEFKGILDVKFIKDSIYTWEIKIDVLKYELSKELKEDFIRRQKENKDALLVYEIIFNENYPFHPPFIRVVRPRFMYQTGHVTVGGSICMESLTPTGWSSARSIESFMVEILSLLNGGGGRLDQKMGNQDYSINEAKEAFNRVAKQHGWL